MLIYFFLLDDLAWAYIDLGDRRLEAHVSARVKKFLRSDGLGVALVVGFVLALCVTIGLMGWAAGAVREDKLELAKRLWGFYGVIGLGVTAVLFIAAITHNAVTAVPPHKP